MPAAPNAMGPALWGAEYGTGFQTSGGSRYGRGGSKTAIMTAPYPPRQILLTPRICAARADQAGVPVWPVGQWWFLSIYVAVDQGVMSWEHWPTRVGQCW